MGVSGEIGSWAVGNKPQLLDGHFHACGDFFFSGHDPFLAATWLFSLSEMVS